MSFCTKCGAQVADGSSFCTACGEAIAQPAAQPVQTIEPVQPTYYQQPAPQVSGLAKAAKILMIISTVVMGLYLIPLAWCIPMTLSYSRKIQNGEPVSTGFKVCTLLFVNTIAGILMLCDN